MSNANANATSNPVLGEYQQGILSMINKPDVSAKDIANTVDYAIAKAVPKPAFDSGVVQFVSPRSATRAYSYATHRFGRSRRRSPGVSPRR